MVYKIMTGNSVIYQSDQKEEFTVSEPALHRGLQDAGSLTFHVPPMHPLYDQLIKMRTFITVYRDDEELFYGRILTAGKNIYGELDVTCEGAYTFLLDSEMGKGTYKETIQAFMARCINAHNAQVESEKRFTLGNITIKKAAENKQIDFKITDYDKTKNILESFLLNQYGGYFRVRYNPNGYHFLDYLDFFNQYSVNGNVDLYNRPVVSKQAMIDAGWTEFDEDYATLHAMVYNDNGRTAMVTPIKVNGEVLSPSDMDDYIGNLLNTTDSLSALLNADKTNNGGYGLIITAVNGETQAIIDSLTDLGDVIQDDQEKMQEEKKHPPIKFGENVISKDDAFTGEGMVTILRPIGKNGITISSLSQEDVTLPGIVKDGELLILSDRKDKYGSFTDTQSFPTASNASDLLKEAENYIQRIGFNLPANASVSYVDFCMLNPDVKALDIGDYFFFVEGYPGQRMLVYDMDTDLENPANDGFTLKNGEELVGNNRFSSNNSLSRSSASGYSHACKVYKYIREEDNLLLFHAEQIEIGAERLNTAVEQLAVIDGTLTVVENTVDEITGSGLWQTRNLITAAIGTMTVHYDSQDPGKIDYISIDDGVGLQLQHTDATTGQTVAEDVVAKPASVSLGTFLSGQMDAGLFIQRLNNGASLIKLHADQIELDGQTVATWLSAEDVTVSQLKVGDLQANSVVGSELIVDTGHGRIDVESLASDIEDLGSIAVASFGTALEENGRITIPVILADGTQGNPINFNIAATQTYKDGLAAVKVAPFTANPLINGQLTDSRTFTYKTDVPNAPASTRQVDTWYLSGGTSWSNNKSNVMLRYGSSYGTVYAKIEVDASSVHTSGYNSGWADSYAAFELDPNTPQTLNPGGSVIIKMKGKSSSSASLADVDDVTISARSLNLQSKSVTSNGTITPDSGYDGLSSVNVNVSSGYDAGWDAAAALTSPPSSGTGQTFVFSAPLHYEKNPGDWVREQVNYNFAISKGSTPGSTGYAAVSMNGTLVGRISIGNWYDTGWADSYAAFELDPNTPQTLNPGGSVIIKMKGKSSSSASLADVDDVTISARSLNLQSKSVTSNGTITPDSGYDGLSSVNVNVSGSSVTPSDISIGSYSSRMTDPGSLFTNASNMRNEILDAISNHYWFTFRVSINGVSGSKGYKMQF